MATITPVAASSAGAAVTFAAATSGGDSLAVGLSSGRCIFHVRNASGGSVTVTLAGAVNCSLGSTHNKAVVCAVGDTEIVIPAHTVDPITGAVAVTYSSATSVTVAATYPNG
jgi:hypothetical protein